MLNMSNGIPQGLVLGSLLFIIYIINLPPILTFIYMLIIQSFNVLAANRKRHSLRFKIFSVLFKNELFDYEYVLLQKNPNSCYFKNVAQSDHVAYDSFTFKLHI